MADMLAARGRAPVLRDSRRATGAPERVIAVASPNGPMTMGSLGAYSMPIGTQEESLMTTAKDIMHTGATWIPAHETLDRAAQLMRDHKVGALPISANGEQDRMIGILTDRDIVVGCVAMGHDPSKMTAGDLAHGTPRWIDAEAEVEAVLEEMQTHRIRRLPVVENKMLIGMISEADLAQHLSDEQIAGWAARVYAHG